MPTHIWTVTEIAEDDSYASPFVYAYTSADAAVRAVEAHHAELWGNADMGDEAPALSSWAEDDRRIRLAVGGYDWPSWLVVRAELKQENEIEDDEPPLSEEPDSTDFIQFPDRD